jgi:hypothetical protein
MGEYWKPVNVTKREYIHPHDLNDGLKMGEWTSPWSQTMATIAERWSDSDVIVYVSDYGGLVVSRGTPPDELPSYGSLDEDGYKRISRR